MKVLLISANTERIIMPTIPIGLASIARATRQAGHEVAFLDLMFETEALQAVRKAIESQKPEVIGISVRNIDDQDSINPQFLLDQVKPVINECRVSTRSLIVLGGAGYSLFPDEALNFLGADLGIEGDGEDTFISLLDHLANGKELSTIPGLHQAGQANCLAPIFPDKLDDYSLDEEDLILSADPNQSKLWVPIQSQRGCPNGCSYCATFRIQGRIIRLQSPNLVAQKVLRLIYAGFHQFYFVDNSFNIPEEHALSLCRELATLHAEFQWRCIIYPKNVSEDLVVAMAKAGCKEVALGFESGSEPVLREMKKRFSPNDVRLASNLFARHGIRRFGFLLFGGPGETKETVEQSLAFADSLKLDALRTTVGIRIYPGTPLARQAVLECVIDDENELLTPRFYIAPGLEPWIHERVTPGFRQITSPERKAHLASPCSAGDCSED